MAGRLDGKVCVITGAASGIGATAARLFADGGREGRRRRPRPGAEGELTIEADVSDEAQVQAMYARRPRRAGPDRRAVQQRRHQPDRRHVGPRDHARGVAASPGREPPKRLPLLQARDPAPARGRRRLGDQHRVVRRRHGRRGLADLLHRLEGRRARALARARGRVRAPRRARQRPVPGAREHAAAPGAVRKRPREGRAAARPPADGALRRGRGDRQGGPLSRRATRAPT